MPGKFAVHWWCILGAWLFVAPMLAKEAGEAANEQARTLATEVTISEETTRILAPVDDEGYIDYLEALNKHTRRGVTPENNANVLFWRAMGPKEILKENRQQFFKRLGIEPLPEKGHYWKDLSSKDFPSGNEQIDQATSRPWSKDEFPDVAKWLETNSKPLELVIEGTKRPEYYSPLVTSVSNEAGSHFKLISILLPGPQQTRDFARALAARAMLRLKEGKADEAWQDLVACHRLGRLVGRGPTLVEALVGLAIDSLACRGDAALAHYGKLTMKQFMQMHQEMSELPPLPDMADRVDRAERFVFLDVATTLARSGTFDTRALTALTGSNNDDDSSIAGRLTLRMVHSMTDWDEVLRRANAQYDRLVAAGRAPTRSERMVGLSQFEAELQRTHSSTKEIPSAAELLLQPRALVTEKVSGVLTSLLLPAVQAVFAAADRAEQKFDLARVSLALGAYRTQHGRYPEVLDNLVPEFLAELPQDRFGSTGLRYEVIEDQVLLYSLGPDQQDDLGSDLNTNGQDDISVHLPPRAQE